MSNLMELLFGDEKDGSYLRFVHRLIQCLTFMLGSRAKFGTILGRTQSNFLSKHAVFTITKPNIYPFSKFAFILFNSSFLFLNGALVVQWISFV
jgi:hypothetical protein